MRIGGGSTSRAAQSDGIMYAVIRTGGKQYKVAAGTVITVDKLAGEAGDTVAFDQVLLVGGEKEPSVGDPLVAGAAVAGEIVGQQRGDKILVFKKRRRQNSKRTRGHRQHETLVRITEILTDGKKPAAAKAKRKTASKAASEAADSKPPSPQDAAPANADAAADTPSAKEAKPKKAAKVKGEPAKADPKPEANEAESKE